MGFSYEVTIKKESGAVVCSPRFYNYDPNYFEDKITKQLVHGSVKKKHSHIIFVGVTCRNSPRYRRVGISAGEILMICGFTVSLWMHMKSPIYILILKKKKKSVWRIPSLT